jgi:hypothetical protein
MIAAPSSITVIFLIACVMQRIRRAESFSKRAAIFNPRKRNLPVYNAAAPSCLSIRSESYNV